MESIVQSTNHLTEEVLRITEEQEKSLNPKTHHSSILLLLEQFIAMKEHCVFQANQKKELESYRCAIVNFVNASVNNFYLSKERLTRMLQIKYSLSLDIDLETDPLTCSSVSFEDYTQILMYQKNRVDFRSRLETIYDYLTHLCVIEEAKEKEKEQEEDKLTENKSINDCICS
jgi:hypothetical protein